MSWNDLFDTERGTPEDDALEAQYWDDMDRTQLLYALSVATTERDALREQLGATESLRRKHQEFAEKMMADRDETLSVLRDLLVALEKEHDITGKQPNRSANTSWAMEKARRRLRAGMEPAKETT